MHNVVEIWRLDQVILVLVACLLHHFHNVKVTNFLRKEQLHSLNRAEVCEFDLSSIESKTC